MNGHNCSAYYRIVQCDEFCKIVYWPSHACTDLPASSSTCTDSSANEYWVFRAIQLWGSIMILWRRWWGWIGNDLHLDDVPRYAVLHFNLHVHYKVENFVGVIWLFSCLSSFWRLDIHSETCCNSKFMMTHQQTLNWKLDQSSFSYGYWKRLFVDLLIEYIGPPSCAHYWMWKS